MIYVTHDQVEAMTMGDRIIVLKDGFVQQIEAPMNLYNNPANKFVAGFIGTPSMNFIKGELISSDNNLFFLTESKKLKVPLPARTKEYLLKQKIEKVWLGVRPEDIFVVNNEVTNDENIIKSEIQLIEPLGNQTLIYFNFEGQQLVCEYRGFLSSKNESNIRFALNTDKIYLFDEKSKERII
jgi:multiple sugar transport system ATP-binding protein